MVLSWSADVVAWSWMVSQVTCHHLASARSGRVHRLRRPALPPRCARTPTAVPGDFDHVLVALSCGDVVEAPADDLAGVDADDWPRGSPSALVASSSASASPRTMT